MAHNNALVARTACFTTGTASLLVAYAIGLRNPLASMASYTAALMILNQLAPPLLLAALPRPDRHLAKLYAFVFDPAIAFVVFVALGVAVSLPALLDPTLADALYATPLGLLELATGLLIWGQLASQTRQIRSNWHLALLVWLASLPMSAVAVVWMLAPGVLYTPYLDVICRWDLPPLVDQKWAGLIMFAAGVPLQLAATWVLLGLSRDDIADRRASEAELNGIDAR